MKRRTKCVLGSVALAVVLVWCPRCRQPGDAPACRPSQPNEPDTPAVDDTPVDPNAPVQTYYVAPDGDDGNSGTREHPWATPGFASRRLKPGDTLVIQGGNYVLSRYDEDIVKPQTGKQGAWITIKGEDGKRPALLGRADLACAIDLSGASYVRLENLEVTHDTGAVGANIRFRDGVLIAGQPAGNLVFKDLYIHHLDEFGVNIQDVDGLEISNCRIEYCGFGAVGGPAGERGGLRNLRITKSRLSYSGHYYQGTDGSNRPYDRPDGFGIEESQGPIEIVDTVAEHNAGDGLDSKAANTTIHRCVVANNSCDGIKLWGDGSKVVNCLVYGTGDGVGGDSPWASIVIGTARSNTRFEIINTTVHDNPTRRAYPMYVQYDSNAPTTVIMRNTIIANGFGLVFFGAGVSLTARNNIFYRAGGEAEQVEVAGQTYTAAQVESGVLGQGNLCKDPTFVQPAWGQDGNYHLKAGSPAIDAGTSTDAPATDLEGTNRPVGSGVDIGTYEQ